MYAKTGDIIANTADQTLLLSGDTLYISDGNNVVLSSCEDTFTDTDDQTLEVSASATLYINEGNNTVHLIRIKTIQIYRISVLINPLNFSVLLMAALLI